MWEKYNKTCDCSNLNSLDMEAISSDAATLKERGVQSRDDADEAIQSINVVAEQLPQAGDDSRVLLKNMAEGSKAITLALESGET